MELLNEILHGGDYNWEQNYNASEFEEIILQDIKQLKKVGINFVTIGVFSWTIYSPKEDVYNFERLEQVVKLLVENDIKIVMSTPSGGFPHWMKKKYTSINRVSKDGIRQDIGNRHNHCYNSPDTLHFILDINTKLAEKFANHPSIILWHISNEMQGECYCDYCKAEFHIYLEKKYGTIEALNRQWNNYFWSLTYDSFEQIELPVSFGSFAHPCLCMNWEKFNTYSAKKMYNFEKESIIRFNSNAKFTTNLCYGHGHNFDYFEFAKDLDIISWDAYPEWGARSDQEIALEASFGYDLMYGLRKMPFFQMESTPNTANWRFASKSIRSEIKELESILAIASGSVAIGYFQMKRSINNSELFHSAIIDPFVTGTRELEIVNNVSQKLEYLDGINNLAKQSRIGLYYDWQVRSAFMNNIGPRYIGGMHYEDYIIDIYKEIVSNGHAIDIFSKDSDITDLDIIIVPMAIVLDFRILENIANFAKKGKTIFFIAPTGLLDEENNLQYGGRKALLDEMLGSNLIEYEALYKDEFEFKYNGETKNARIFFEYIKNTTAETMILCNSDLYEIAPIITKNNYKNAKVINITSPIHPSIILDIIKTEKNLDDEKNLIKKVRANDKRTYTFLLNFSDEEIKFARPYIGVNVYTNEIETHSNLGSKKHLILWRDNDI